MDRYCHSICFDLIDLHIVRCTVMVCDQIIQAFLYRFSIHGPSAGKFHTITKGDLYCIIVCKFIVCSKPWLYLHVVIVLKQCFSYTITQTAPSGIIVVRV